MRGQRLLTGTGMLMLSGLIIVAGISALMQRQRLRSVRAEKLHRATERWEDEGGAVVHRPAAQR
jgi:hypothetical protein